MQRGPACNRNQPLPWPLKVEEWGLTSRQLNVQVPKSKREQPGGLRRRDALIWNPTQKRSDGTASERQELCYWPIPILCWECFVTWSNTFNLLIIFCHIHTHGTLLLPSSMSFLLFSCLTESEYLGNIYLFNFTDQKLHSWCSPVCHKLFPSWSNTNRHSFFYPRLSWILFQSKASM